MIVLVLLVYACTLGEFILEATYEDFKIKYIRTLMFPFVSNETSDLKHLAPNYYIFLFTPCMHFNMNAILFTVPYHFLVSPISMVCVCVVVMQL
jgi:hypothetical protein